MDEALKEDFGLLGERAIERWKSIDPTHPTVFDLLQTRGAMFCSWTGKERKANFLPLLMSFDPIYESTYNLRLKSGEKGLLAPEEFAQWADVEWPDPRW